MELFIRWLRVLCVLCGSITSLLFVLASPVWAAEPAPAVEARTAYQAGDFVKAGELYDEAYRAGERGSALCFNLGNTWYRRQQLGQSIFWYRRALDADPANADAARNLEFVRGKRVDRIETETPGRVAAVFAWFRRQSRALCTLGDYLLPAGILLLLFRGRRRSWLAVTMLGAALLALGGGLLLFERSAGDRDFRVIVAPKAEVYASPQEGLPTLVVHDGLEVELRRGSGDFREIMIGEGTIGWVKNEALSPPIRRD